jgi:hypothetical protein
MSMRKILLGVAAFAVGLGAIVFSRGRDHGDAMSKKPQPWVRSTRLASPPSHPLDHPLGMIVDGEFLYFVSGGFANAENAVHRLSTGGGSVDTLTKVDQILSGELAVDETSVYFTSEVDSALLQVKKSSSAATVLAKVAGPKYLTVDATHVYFVTLGGDSGGSVQRIAKSGGSPEILISGHAGLDSIVVDAQSVYFRSNQGLFKLPKSGGAAQRLFARTDKQNLQWLALDDSNLYFFLETADAGKYAVARLAKSGGSPETLSSVVDSAGRLALSATHVYFFRAAGLIDNVLAKVPKAGGQTETVDGAGNNNGYLTVSAGNVYFGDVDTIYRVPK